MTPNGTATKLDRRAAKKAKRKHYRPASRVWIHAVDQQQTKRANPPEAHYGK